MLLLVALGTVSTGAEILNTQSILFWLLCVIDGDLGFDPLHFMILGLTHCASSIRLQTIRL
jgi:hypothetical protein